jgi:hypothetical protein
MVNRIIDEERLKDLLKCEEKILRLNCGGVDNWQWYGESLNPEGGVPMDEFEPCLKDYLVVKNEDIDL